MPTQASYHRVFTCLKLGLVSTVNLISHTEIFVDPSRGGSVMITEYMQSWHRPQCPELSKVSGSQSTYWAIPFHKKIPPIEEQIMK